MKTILVCKSGTVFRPRSSSKSSSSRGEQGETEGLIRHLVDRGDCNIVYFGRYSGDEILTHSVIGPSLDAVKPYTHDPASCPASAQDAGFDDDERELRQHDEIVGFINMMGYSATMSIVGNPKQTIVQAAGINYVAPMLAALQRLKIPRICIVTDPRCYPRDQEMTYGWGWARPRALLDQYALGFQTERVIGGSSFAVHTVYGAPQSWGTLERAQPVLSKVLSTCVAHAHVKTGIHKSSWDPWRSVLRDVPLGFEMWGEGWDDGPFEDEPWVRGPCRADEVSNMLSRGVACPVVEHTRGFLTGKPYVVRAAGAIPLLFGNYDSTGVLLPLDHPSRMHYDDSLRDKCEWVSEHVHELENIWDEALKPDFSVLDRLVDDLLAGKSLDGRYGEYVRS